MRIGSVEDFFFAFVSAWLAWTLNFILGLPSLGSSVALTLCIIMTTLSHTGIPIFFRVIHADRIVRGPFHLGIQQVLVPNSNSRRALDSL